MIENSKIIQLERNNSPYQFSIILIELIMQHICPKGYYLLLGGRNNEEQKNH